MGPRERQRLAELRRAQGRRRLVVEVPYRRPDGGERWLRVSTGPLRDGAGRDLGSLHLVTDITREVATEEALSRAACTTS